MFFRRRRIVRRRSGAGCLLGIVLLFLIVFVFLRATRAQGTVTYDDVNTVAARMYCPECENIPLDKCFTEVCVQWKQDIADQLAAGRSSDAIVDDFVARFGDQVVGVPQDSLLRTLTLVAPWVLAGAFAVFGIYTVLRMRTTGASREAAAVASSDTTLDGYRQRIERELSE